MMTLKNLPIKWISMQAQKRIIPFSGLAFALVSCVGIHQGPEAGVHGGLFNSGVHASYQKGQAGVELGYNKVNVGVFDVDDEEKTLYMLGRYHLGTVFVLKAGLFYSDLKAVEEARYYGNNSSQLTAKMLGPRIGFGNIWHLKGSIALGVEYVTLYRPVYVWDRTLTADSGRFTENQVARTDEKIKEGYIDGANLYIGIDF